MSAVDERVVEMQFNNRQFEKGVAQSTESIQALKKSLDFSDTERTLSSFQKTSNGFSLSGISDSLSIVADRFSFMGIVADEVIRTITNKVMSLAGVFGRLIKSFTLSPIISGWQSYGEQATAVQRIISSGFSIDESEEALKLITKYTDETSWNMDDMTNGLGKFTRANVSLDDSLKAIVGIGNAASAAGINSWDMAHAIDGVAGALGAGVLRSQHWQWLETSNITTHEFNENLLEAAVNAGKITKIGEDSYKTIKGTVFNAAGIRNVLNEGIITNEILMTALGRYGQFTFDVFDKAAESGKEVFEVLEELEPNMDDLSERAFRAGQETKTFKESIEATRIAVSSGWAQTFKQLFGNYDEAKQLWSYMSEELFDIFVEPIKLQNKMLENWHTDNYDKFLESLFNVWEGVKSLITPISEAMHDMFPTVTLEQFTAFTDKIHDATEKFKNLFTIVEAIEPTFDHGKQSILEYNEYVEKVIHNEEVEKRLEKIRSVTKIVTSILAIGKNLLGAIWRTLQPVGNLLKDLAPSIFNAGASLGEWLDALRQTIEENDSFYNFFQKIINFFNTLTTASDGSRLSIGGFIKKLKGFKPLDILMNSIAAAKEKLDANGGLGGILGNAASSAWGFIKSFANTIGEKLKTIMPTIIDTIKNIDFDKAMGFLGALLGARLSYNIGWALKSVFNNIKGFFNIKWSLGEVFNELTTTLGMLQDRIEAQGIRSIAVSVAILAGSMLLLSGVPQDRLLGVAAAIAALTWNLVFAFKALSTFSKFNYNLGEGGFISKLGQFITGGSAVGKQVMLMTTMGTFLRKIATAILLLAISMKIMSGIDPDSMLLGFITIIGFIEEFMFVAKRMDKEIVGAEAASRMMNKMAKAIIVLAVAVRILAVLNPDQIMAGVLAIGSLMLALGAFVTLVGPKIQSFGGRGAGAMVSIAYSLLILAGAAKAFGNMEWAELGKAGAAIGGLLLALGLFISFVNGSSAGKVAGAVLVLSISMAILAGVVKSLSKLTWEGLAKGMAAMAASLLIMAGGIALVKAALGTGGAGAVGAILLLAVAMQMLVPPFVALSLIKWGDLFKPIAAIAAAFAVLGVAALLLTPVIPAMFALAGVLALLGVATVLISAGLVTFNAAVAVSAAEGAVAVAAIIGHIKMLIYGIDEMIPQIIGLLGHLVGALIIGIGEMIVPIGHAIVDLLIKLLVLLGTSIGPVVKQLVIFLIQIINALAEAIRTVGEEGLFPAIKNLLSSIIELVLRLLGDLLAMIPGWGDKIKGALDKAADSVKNFMVDEEETTVEIDVETKLPEDPSVTVDVETEYNPESPLIPLENVQDQAAATGEEYGNVFGEAVNGALGEMHLDIPGFNMDSENGESAFNVFSGDFLGSFTTATGDAQTAGGDLAKAALEGMAPYSEEFSAKGLEMSGEFSTGLIEDSTGVQTSGAELGAAGVYGVQSQKSGMIQAGRDFVLGFMNGMNGLRDTLYQVAYNIGYQALQSAKNAIHSNSPSKAMMQVGEWFDEGFIIGMESMAGDVSDAGYDIGDTAVKSMNNVLATLSDRLDSEMVSDPVISPVIDLTNVRAGISEIDAMLANHPIMPANMGAIVPPINQTMRLADMMQKNQNGTPTTVNLTVTTQELSNSTVDYLVNRVNKVLGGKV